MTESRLPPMAIVLSVAGLVPFIFCALAAARNDPATDTISTLSLITYAAVILSFIGAVHWGFVIEGAKEPSERLRLGLGVLPGLLGWMAAVLGLAAHATLGLALLIATYIATVVVEGRFRHFDSMPGTYLVLRWALTIIVVAILTTVLVVRMAGANLVT